MSMTVDSQTRVLLVPDVIWGGDSGAVSARFSASLLHKLGYEVGVYAYQNISAPEGSSPECNFRFMPRRPSASIHHFWGGKVNAEFKEILADFRPDYVFFAGGAINKPYWFFQTCIEQKIPFNLLFYINDYYCSRIYAGLIDGPCFKCIEGNYGHAYSNNCISGGRRIVRFLKSALVLRRLRNVLHKCHRALGYSEDQLSLYQRYGFTPEQCLKTPTHFNNDCIQGAESSMGDYFVLCGQSTIEKGWHYMADVMRLCPDARIKVVFPTEAIAEKNLKAFALQDFVGNRQIEIITGLKEHDDLISLLAGARGVLIPSNYPTTGEFVMMESLGLGKPIIVFDAGMHAEIIRSGENGLMAKLGDVEEFASHVNALDADEELYSRLAKGARLLFEELNSFEKLAASSRQAFQPLCSEIVLEERQG